MRTLMILADEVANEATVVNEFEQTLLRIFILIIMFGLGAGLTPKDFSLALRRPWGLFIGWITQFGIMPLTAYVLIVTVLFPFSTTTDVMLVALGALIMGSVPAGTLPIISAPNATNIMSVELENGNRTVTIRT